MGMRLLQLAAALLTLASVSAAASAEPCRDETFRSARYIVCTFDPAKDDLRLYWRGPDGQPLRTFNGLAQALDERGKTLVFAMNGGMYERDLSPVGLHIENGRLLSKADTKTVTGRPSQIPNFYKKPNGVFYLGEGGAGVLETGRFLKARPPARFATQSGPMLVIDGAIHPAFIVKSKDLKPRNGVGVSDDGKVQLAMTRGRVSFYEFARFFRDGLGTENALFLDGGTAPGLYAPELRRNDPPSHGGYGPIIAVVK
jgi:uncharacterized protein YigE (DUF2233 family)